MKKPDRFERAAEKACMDWVNGEQREGWKSVPIKLLRAEHAWMELMVKQLEKENTAPGTFYDGYTCALLKVLHLLEQRRK